MDGLGDLEGVVLGEELDGGLDFGVFEDFRRDLIQGSGCSSGGSYWILVNVGL